MAYPPTCFGGQVGTYNAYTKVGTGKSELIIGTEGNDVIYAGGGDDVRVRPLCTSTVASCGTTEGSDPP
jgi:hemolysin type calcium-binding protein